MGVRVRNLTTGEVLGSSVRMADSFIDRLRGLMLHPRLAYGQGLLLNPCKSIHTHFMQFPIDVIFINRERRVVAVIPGLRPWRQSPVVREAQAVLELPQGGAGSTCVGDILALD